MENNVSLNCMHFDLHSSVVISLSKPKIKNVAPPGETRNYTTRTYQFDPLTVNIPRCKVEDLRGGDPAQNAKEFELVLQGGDYINNAKKDATCMD